MESVGETERGSGLRTTKGKLDISVVEGSFRRIAGIREFADDSGTFVVRVVEILREPGESLGFYIRQGDGWDRNDGVFVSRVNLGSMVETSGLLSIGDEITKVNDIDVTHMSLEAVAVIMRYVKRLFLTVKVLTSPALVRTLSLRSEQRRALNEADSGTVSLRPKSSGDRELSVRNRKARVIPSSNEALVPYAYTRIKPETQDDADSPGYEIVRHQSVKESRSGEAGKESLGTLEGGHNEERDLNLIDYDNIDQLAMSEPHSGQLTLVLDTVNNLIPVSNDPLVCSVSCDSEPSVKVSLAAHKLREGVANMKQEYHIQLNMNCKISFSLVNGVLSSVKTIPFAYFFPTPQSPRSQQQFALTLSPIGQLRFTLGFSPLPLAVPRWGSVLTPIGGLEEMVATNPTGSGLPLVVERAIRVVEEYGIETHGLYQVTASEVAKGEALAACQSKALQPSHLRTLVPQLTVHAFTGILKDFFFNLPQPIFPADFTTSAHKAMNKDEEQFGDNERVSLSTFTESLPDEVQVTVCALLAHFRNVCQHGATNGTSLDKISQIFAPLLFTPAHGQEGTLMSHGDFTQHANILKELVLHCK